MVGTNGNDFLGANFPIRDSKNKDPLKKQMEVIFGFQEMTEIWRSDLLNLERIQLKHKIGV